MCADGSCERESEPVPRNGAARRVAATASGIISVTLIAGALLAFAGSAVAAPRPIGPLLRSWSVSKIERGVGSVAIGRGTQRSGQLDKLFDLGSDAFNFKVSALDGRAVGKVFTPADHSHHVASELLAQTPSLDPFDPRSAEGSATHLDESQVYEKRKGDQSIRFTSDVSLETVDENGPLTSSECPVVGSAPCPSIRTIVHYRVRAWTFAGGHPFFDVGGAVFGEGHEHAWAVGVATDPRSRGPFWKDAQFFVNGDVDGNKSGRRLLVSTVSGPGPIEVNVPLRSLGSGQLFVVKVSMDAETIDERGHESAASAFVADPPHTGSRLAARGLNPHRGPQSSEPATQPQPAARCPAGPSPHGGTVQLSSPAFTVGEASGTPLVLVTRTRGSRGATSVTVKTSGGTARSGSDFKPTKTLVRFENGDTSPRLVEIPIREDMTAERPESFTVSLAGLRCAKLGKQRSASVTILDDDQPPATPGGSSPTFTVGGTVDGLEGSGLMLVNQTTQLHVAGNGRFTFPGTFPAGSPLDVRVQAQPTNPDQVCSVVDGTGTIIADVTNVAVHCTRVAIPAGLDTTFGSGGRVTIPITGEGRAVLIQPGGGIVTVGPRDVGNTFHFDFAATRHDAAGNLDPTFGTGGIATTDLGGKDDKAKDAALLADGGFVTVGLADPAGLANTDFGIARYTPDGQPSPAFPVGGFVTTDVAHRSDGANAVAVQPDGKIVAAGFAQTSPIDFDFALARYNPDGTVDRSFGANGIVTTDLGSLDDAANGVAIQSDGKIVAVGVSGENVALARYLPDGALDPTFNGGGTAVSDLGFDDVANGVAITPGGTILVAGTRLGAHINLDAYVASYGPNGRLNLGFGSGGVASADLSGGDDFGDDLVLDASGDIIVVGTATSATVTDMALVRFKPDGTVAASLTTDFHGTGDFGHALTIDPQGRIVAAGSSGDQFALMRANL